MCMRDFASHLLLLLLPPHPPSLLLPSCSSRFPWLNWQRHSLKHTTFWGWTKIRSSGLTRRRLQKSQSRSRFLSRIRQATGARLSPFYPFPSLSFPPNPPSVISPQTAVDIFLLVKLDATVAQHGNFHSSLPFYFIPSPPCARTRNIRFYSPLETPTTPFVRRTDNA